MKNALKENMITAAVWATILGLSFACAALSAKPTEPCNGMYCIQVTVAGVPGAPLVCYKTPDELAMAKSYWKGAGYQVSDVLVKDK